PPSAVAELPQHHRRDRACDPGRLFDEEPVSPGQDRVVHCFQAWPETRAAGMGYFTGKENGVDTSKHRSGPGPGPGALFSRLPTLAPNALARPRYILCRAPPAT